MGIWHDILKKWFFYTIIILTKFAEIENKK